MEYGSRLRFALVVIGAIILLIVSVWGVTSIARRLLNGEPQTGGTTQQVALDQYVRPGTYVRLTAEGPIVADENFRSYQIDIAQDHREIKIFKGYNRNLVDTKYFDNNPEAYVNFLKALSKANFTSYSKTASDDRQGACANGRRYTYELYDQGSDVVRSWGSSCSGIGNFTGQGTAVRSLFRTQIPSVGTLLGGIDF